MHPENRKKICLLSIVLLTFFLVQTALCENTGWDCPQCGRTGNTDNYCGGCSHPAPWIIPGFNLAADDLRILATEILENSKQWGFDTFPYKQFGDLPLAPSISLASVASIQEIGMQLAGVTDDEFHVFLNPYTKEVFDAYSTAVGITI